MSIQNEIDRIKENVADAYSAVEERGGTVPETATVENLAAAVSSIPKRTIFATDETLNMSEDNVLSVTIPVKEMTEAEYNALPESQKNRGLYFVTSAPMTVGETVQWAGYDWIVVNDNGDNTVALAANTLLQKVAPGYHVKYENSQLVQLAQNFENGIPSSVLSQAVYTTVENVTAKIFVATYAQCNGGFSYFNNNASRICKYNGSPDFWWTSSNADITSLWIVTDAGKLYNGYASEYDVGYFRPFVTLKQSEQKTTVYLNGKELDSPTGTPGVTFTPHLSTDGILSWTNDGGLENPAPVDLRGPAGADGTNGNDGFSPTVAVTDIDGGHQVTITDADGPKTFDVMNGTNGSGNSGLIQWEDINGRPDLSAVSSMKTAPIVLNHLLWDESNQQTIPVAGVVADEEQQLIVVAPKRVSRALFNSYGIECVDQEEDALVFSCKTIPEEDISVNVFIFGAAEVGQEYSGEFVWWSPHMTSDNTPAPYAVYSDKEYIDGSGKIYDAYKAFDGNITASSSNIANSWYGGGRTTSGWIEFDFGKSTFVKGIRIFPDSFYSSYFPGGFLIEGSNDRESYATIANVKINDPSSVQWHEIVFNKVTRYRFYKVSNTIKNTYGDMQIIISEIEFLKLEDAV